MAFRTYKWHLTAADRRAKEIIVACVEVGAGIEYLEDAHRFRYTPAEQITGKPREMHYGPPFQARHGRLRAQSVEAAELGSGTARRQSDVSSRHGWRPSGADQRAEGLARRRSGTSAELSATAQEPPRRAAPPTHARSMKRPSPDNFSFPTRGARCVRRGYLRANARGEPMQVCWFGGPFAAYGIVKPTT